MSPVITLIFEAGLVLFACSCVARSEKMVPQSFEVRNKIAGSVKIDEVVGARQTNSFQMWMSQISSTAFTEALIESITEAGLFDSVVKSNADADYFLDVTILDYDQPLFGLDLNIKMKTQWQLTDAKKFVPVWTETFETAYKAKFDSALLPAEKSRKAYEGAIRVNIREGIRRLALMKL